MPCVETATGDLFYTLSQGPKGAPALVLLHGAGGTRLHWPAELRRLDRVTVYTLDLPGHGRSGGQGHDTIAGYAEAVAAFLHAVGIEQFVVAGHSMGGAIAMTLALDLAAPATTDVPSALGQVRVAGLVLVATGARLRVATAILEGIGSDFEKSVELITRLAWSSEARPSLTRLGRQALLEAGPQVLLDDLTACDGFDVMERLAEIEAPTLVVAGSADQLTPVKYARFLAEHISGARLAIIEDAGHMVMLERPVATAKAVQEFLEEKPPR
jgi:pimeloyl-ACP methyl ester carboxylesterase